MSRILICVLLCLGLTSRASAAAEPAFPDLTYAVVDSKELKLDLYLPENVEKPPLVVFVHGGGWVGGSRKNCIVKWLTEYGFAVASIQYRLSQEAIWPAQIHDCKGAIRWLRANADTYGYDATRIGAAGSSAGGQLVAMLGVSGDMKELEGDVGGNLDQSSRVQVVIDYFGATDFILRSGNQPGKTEQSGGSVYKLLGGPVSEKLDAARQASACYHVTADDAPLYALHGSKDTTVYVDQTERIVEEYKKAKLPVQYDILEGSGHGGKEFTAQPYRDKVAAFLKKYLAAE